MAERFSREALLIGQEGVKKLQASKVAVFGAGGVGGYVIEALARSGVGELAVIDGDSVSLSNINRQILALESTLGLSKVQAAQKRIKEIDPNCRVKAIELFFTGEQSFPFSEYDYIVDAVDMVSAKLEIIRLAKEASTPVISCMGAGNKFDPTAFRVTDIEETRVCPLARVMRKELKRRGITGVKAVWSPEKAARPEPYEGEDRKGRSTPGSMAFVPSAAGLILACEVVKDLLGGWPKNTGA